MSARCYVITDPETGEVVATVRAERSPTSEAIAAFRELAKAAVRRMSDRPINDEPPPRPPPVRPLPPPTPPPDDDE